MSDWDRIIFQGAAPEDKRFDPLVELDLNDTALVAQITEFTARVLVGVRMEEDGADFNAQYWFTAFNLSQYYWGLELLEYTGVSQPEGPELQNKPTKLACTPEMVEFLLLSLRQTFCLGHLSLALRSLNEDILEYSARPLSTPEWPRLARSLDKHGMVDLKGEFPRWSNRAEDLLWPFIGPDEDAYIRHFMGRAQREGWLEMEAVQ